MKLNQAKTRSASTGSIRTRSTSVSTNSRGQTEEDIQRENETGISHDLENPEHDDHHEDNNSERGEESEEDQTLEDLEATAKASNVAARLLTSRNILLGKGMDILHSQGADMSIHCDEIDALNLSESGVRIKISYEEIHLTATEVILTWIFYTDGTTSTPIDRRSEEADRAYNIGDRRRSFSGSI